MRIGDLFWRARGDSSELETDLVKGATKAGQTAGQKGGSTLGAQINRSAGKALTAGGAAVGAFVAGSLEQFGSFQQGMNEVFTLLPDITKTQMDKMSGDVESFARETGKLPDEVIPALYQAISAGVPPDNVFEFLRTANKNAVGGVTDLETSVDGLSSVVNAYGSDVLSASQASDIMFTGVRLGKTTIDELSKNLFNVVPTASALGVSFGDVTAAMAAMTAQGVPTNVASTQLRQLFVELSKSSSKTSQTFEKLSGKTFKEFIAGGGNVQQALQIMEKGATKAGVGVNDLFQSVEAGSAALTLTGKGTQTFTNDLEAMSGSAGSTDKAFATMDTGITQTAKKWAATAVTFGIDTGKAFAPFGPALLVMNQLSPALGGLLSPAKLLGGAFGSLGGKLVTKLIPSLVGLVPALGGTLAGVGTSIGGLISAAIPIGMAALPVILIAAIVAAIAILILNPDIRNKVFEVGGSIVSGIVNGAAGLIGGLLDVFGQATGAVVDAIGGFVGQVVSAILAIPGQVVALGVDLLTLWANIELTILGVAADLVRNVVGLFLSIPGAVAGLIGQVVGIFIGLAGQVVGNVAGLIGQVVGFYLSIPGRIAGLVGQIAGVAARAIAGFLANVVTGAGRVVSTVLGIPGQLVGLVGSFADIARRMVEGFIGFIAAIPGKVADILGGVGDFVGSLIPHFAAGALEIPRDMLAVVHQGEMIIPANDAAAIRTGTTTLGANGAANAAGGRPINVVVNNPAPEPASTSVKRRLQVLAAFGVT